VSKIYKTNNTVESTKGEFELKVLFILVTANPANCDFVTFVTVFVIQSNPVVPPVPPAIIDSSFCEESKLDIVGRLEIKGKRKVLVCFKCKQ
jgi:hypothetical protein